MKNVSPSGFAFFVRIPNNEIINERNHVFPAGRLQRPYTRLDGIYESKRTGRHKGIIGINTIARRRKNRTAPKARKYFPVPTFVSVYERHPATMIRASVTYEQ